jgi:UDP-glucose 4-epimerase
LKALVTGAAGFIGSHLAEELVRQGWTVVGLDSFTDYYAPALKERNLSRLRETPGFELVTGDLLSADLELLLQSVEVVFHQAGQPGVRRSWGRSFDAYTNNNILATQRLLEAALSVGSLQRFVFASSSSVYGDSPDLPYSERSLPQPVSPYGVTKLAAEHLCRLYSHLGVPAVSLRYFTVYGPRQRPDMAFTRFIQSLLEGTEIVVYGDGEQTRDFTYVSDIVAANMAAATVPLEKVAGRTFNLGGGSRVKLRDVIAQLEGLTGCSARLRFDPAQRGDARHTHADCTAARETLGFIPQVQLQAGLEEQVRWAKEQTSL